MRIAVLLMAKGLWGYANGDIKEPSRRVFVIPSSSSSSQNDTGKDKEDGSEGEQTVNLQSETAKEPLHHFKKHQDKWRTNSQCTLGIIINHVN
jgi:hypothetical protein